jgi:hypothetical protein
LNDIKHLRPPFLLLSTAVDGTDCGRHLDVGRAFG